MIHLRGRDQAQDGWRQEGTRSHVLQEVLAQLPQVRLADPLVRGSRNRAVHAHGHHIAQQRRIVGGRLSHEIHDATQILVEEHAFAQAVHPAAPVDEALPTGATVEPGELLLHRTGHAIQIFQQVDARAVLVQAAPLRIQAHQRQVVLGSAATARDDAAHHLRHGQDGGTHVEAKPRLVEHVHLAAQMQVALHHGHLHARGAQLHRRGQTSQTTTHHDRSLAHVTDSVPAAAGCSTLQIDSGAGGETSRATRRAR